MHLLCNFRFRYLLFALCFISSILFESAAGNQLGMMQTADTLGKGGNSSQASVLAYQKLVQNDNSVTQSMVIGNFAEQHQIKYDAKAILLPLSLTFGITENVDLAIGGTYSVGQVSKEVANFFQTDDPDKNTRVYPQPIFNGEIAVKYGIKPESQDGLPAVAIFGRILSGFTGDDRINSDGEFQDQTPADGMSFIAVEPQILATLNLGQALRFHAAGGLHMSSKGLNIVPLLQLGAEFALSDSIWATVDFSRTAFVNGFRLDNISSGGLRYDISENATLSLSLTSKPGLQLSFNLGGDKEEVVIPKTPEDDMDLPF